MSGRERRDLMLRLADLIEQNAEELATFEAHDNGALFAVVDNVQPCLRDCAQASPARSRWPRICR
jgi:acyl-CoA reductase-like NAD-dependent aldehyde dehydrogenase